MNTQNKENQKLSPEELAKTQVLNLSDVEKIAKYEKSTSKKPAIIFAIVGIFSLTMGIMYPSIISFVDRKADKDEVILNRITDNEKDLINNNANKDSQISSSAPNAIAPTKLTCTISTPATVDGTDKTLTYNFTFVNNLLQSYTKLLVVNPTNGNPQGPTTITNYLTNYQNLSQVQINGYQPQITKTTTGFTLTINIDLTKVNQQLLPANLQQDPNTKIEFILNNDKATLTNNMVNAKYTCN